MPRGDRRGPDGMGLMTGRGLGYCNDYDSPGFTKGAPRSGAGFGKGLGRGFRRGNGRGFGNGRRFRDQRFYNYPNYPAVQYSAKDERKYLESEIDILKNELKDVEKRLSELKEEDD